MVKSNLQTSRTADEAISQTGDTSCRNRSLPVICFVEPEAFNRKLSVQPELPIHVLTQILDRGLFQSMLFLINFSNAMPEILNACLKSLIFHNPL